jgi:streptogramin lyase
VTVTAGGPNGAQAVAYGFGSIWTGESIHNSIVRIDPHTNRVIARITYPNFEPCGLIAVGASSLWISECLEGDSIARIDPLSNTITAVYDTTGEVESLAPQGDAVWFVTGPDPSSTLASPGYLEELSAGGSVERRVDMGAGFATGGILIAFGSLWITPYSQPVAIRIPDS